MPYYATSTRSRPRLSTQVKIDEVMKALQQRGVKHDYCPRCDTKNWNIDLVEIPANSALSEQGLPYFRAGTASGYLSLLAVVCTNCGNTIFHNLDILGISLR
jgi:hypothetical protein